MHCTKETVDDIKGKKAIFLLNHHYELDWLFSWMCADAYGVLGIINTRECYEKYQL